MSKGNFEITRVKLTCPVDVASVPETYFDSQKHDIRLTQDPRFISIVSKSMTKFPPTLVPLTNVAYMFVVDVREEDRAAKEKGKK
jgi:hypothetical protein